MKTWKGLTVFCISFLCCYFGQSLMNFACGPEADPYDYAVNFFHNNLTGDNAYQPFYYNGDLFLNDDSEPAREDLINAEEWARHTGKSTRDILKVMYQLTYAADMTVVYDCLEKRRPLPDSLRKNGFLRYLLKRSNRKQLQYYIFVKKVQLSANNSGDGKWNATGNPDLIYKNALSALSFVKTEQDPFLKLRYYYQAQRLMHYSGHRDAAGKIYDRYILKFHSHSHVQGWAMALKAGEEWGTNNPHAAYLMSRVFAEDPERRIQAFHDFHTIGVKTEQVLWYAKNNQERANIYAMIGFHEAHISLTSLKMVYRYQPSSKLLIVLLAREINKLEANYLSPRFRKNLNYYHFDPVNYDWGIKTTPAQFKAYMTPLKAFCKQLGHTRSTNAPLGNIVAAYLDWMQNHPDDGLNTMATLDGQTLTARFNDQKQMIKLLLLSQKIKYLDSAAEQSLLPGLQWLDKKMAQEATTVKSRIIRPEEWYDNYDLRRFSLSGRDFYQKVLAPLYLKQHDTTKAGLAFFKSAINIKDLNDYQLSGGTTLAAIFQDYLHSKNLNEMIRYKFNSPEDPYLKVLCNPLKTVDRDFLYELTGTAYLREHNYMAAVKMLKKMRPSTCKSYSGGNFPEDISYLMGDPFISKLNDYPILKGKKQYTKLIFAEAMAKLQRQTKMNPRNAANEYFKMATGLYNTSFYGNSWYLINYSWADADRGRASRFYFDDDYIRTKNAEQMFLMARSASKDPEFRARCTFMAANSRQKQVVYWPWPDYISNEKEYNRRIDEYYRQRANSNLAITKNYYFTDLKQHYPNTRFFKTAISECSYFRDFLHIEKPKPQKRKSI